MFLDFSKVNRISKNVNFKFGRDFDNFVDRIYFLVY